MFEEFCQKNKLPSFRLEQLNTQYYKNSINSWDELTNWSLDLREKIKKDIPFSLLHNFKEFVSRDNRTTKTVSFTKELYPVETVLMKSSSRNTICVSCMSGCPVGCKFCATGQMKFNRNLSILEIVDQVMYFKRKLQTTGQTITNIVFMGMGEPMLNLSNVIEAIKIITDSKKIGLGHRRVTVSTVGYIKQLNEFLDKDLGVKIAISLHTPKQSLREELMPQVAKENKLDDLIDVLKEYQRKTNKRITYEYLLMKDVNDSSKDARELAQLLRNQIVLVNLINLNKSNSIPYYPTTRERVTMFQDVLNSMGIKNTLRYSYGKDIYAACGQLANANP